MPTKSSIVIAGHGSRVASSNAEFEEFVRQYQARRPDLDVSFGYIELAEPLLEEALRRKARESAAVALVPLFLFASGHVKNEMPAILENVRRDFPNVKFTAAPAIGVHPAAVSLASDRLASVPGEDAVIVMVGRGSGHPEANGDFFKICRLVGESCNPPQAPWVLPCFVGITNPRLPEALDAAARFQSKTIVVAPYFIFDGVLLNRIRDQIDDFKKRAPGVTVRLAPHLGIDERLFEIMDERVS